MPADMQRTFGRTTAEVYFETEEVVLRRENWSGRYGMARLADQEKLYSGLVRDSKSPEVYEDTLRAVKWARKMLEE